MLLMTENEANDEKLRKTKETNNNVPKWPTSWTDNGPDLPGHSARTLSACVPVGVCVWVHVFVRMAEEEQKRMKLSKEHEKVKVN